MPVSGSAARLQDVSEQDDIINYAPTVALGWIQAKSSTKPVLKEDLVQIPLYQDMDRTSIVEYFSIPCDKRQSGQEQQWSIKAIALFLNSDESA